MLMKESLLLVFAIILLNYVNNECEATQCYSCSDCPDSTKTNWKTIQTIDKSHQCMKATILAPANPTGQKIIYRGASSMCRPSSSKYGEIVCCNTDFCNT